jgi:hypothetical protein
MPELTRPQKITLGEMRASGVRGLLSDDVRLSGIEPLFTCQACGQRGADVRPNFDWEQEERQPESLKKSSGLI